MDRGQEIPNRLRVEWRNEIFNCTAGNITILVYYFNQWPKPLFTPHIHNYDRPKAFKSNFLCCMLKIFHILQGDMLKLDKARER